LVLSDPAALADAVSERAAARRTPARDNGVRKRVALAIAEAQRLVDSQRGIGIDLGGRADRRFDVGVRAGGKWCSSYSMSSEVQSRVRGAVASHRSSGVIRA